MPLTTGPQGPAGIQGPAGPAASDLSGDVTGAPSATTVERIQGRPVATIPPTTGQYLMWNGTAWAAADWPT